MTKTGRKVRTASRKVRKFGARRKRQKTAVQSSEKPQQATGSPSLAENEPQPSTSTGGIPSTSGGVTAVASKRKLSYFQKEDTSSDADTDDSEEEGAEVDTPTPEELNLLMNVGCLQTIIGRLSCPECHKATLAVHEGGKEFRQGSACYVEVCCSDCGKVSWDWTSKKTGSTHTGYNINRRIATSASVCGFSFSQIGRQFALLGLPPPMSESTWYFYKQKIHTGVKRAVDRHLQEAANQIRRTYADMNIGIPNEDGVLNISVSIDGSWHKRGHTSHNGVVTVIETMTGLIVDFITLSNYCQECESGPKPEDANYEQWAHDHRSKCQKNIDCSSGAMEMEGAVKIFERSMDLHGFRYTEMLGDGDAKTYKRVIEADPYGGYPIEKLECVNHVTKRMGTALRNLVQKRKAQSQPIGGRGKLTDARIKKLTNYYGSAIKTNAGNLEDMKKAVWASLFHTISTDDNHNHTMCPEGASSWCFFNRACANEAQPPPHDHPLPADIGDALQPIYERLGDPSLLRRCLAGKTQNANESFHSLLWDICPKEWWATLRTVDTALSIAVPKFNQGSTALLDIMHQLELMKTTTAEYAEQEDVRRVKKATKRSSEDAQAKRRRIEDIRRKERQAHLEREGPAYGAGDF